MPSMKAQDPGGRLTFSLMGVLMRGAFYPLIKSPSHLLGFYTLPWGQGAKHAR